MKIQNIIEQIKSINSIANINNRKKKVLMSQMRNDDIETEAPRQGIANTVEKFYGVQYKSENAKDISEEKNESPDATQPTVIILHSMKNHMTLPVMTTALVKREMTFRLRNFPTIKTQSAYLALNNRNESLSSPRQRFSSISEKERQRTRMKSKKKT